MIARSDLVGAGILSGAFLGLLLIAEVWARVGSPRPEWTRKFVHLGGGMTCLLFPFLIESSVVVFAMAVSLSLLFAVGGKTRRLKSLHRVERKTHGSEYYPLAIFLTFLMCKDARWMYVSAVLVLAVADACAALLGSRIGRHRYEVEDETKSLEGSLIFFVIAFVAIFVPAVLFTELAWEECALAALLVALLVTGFEVISLSGTDNLFIPLGVCAILPKITSKPLVEMLYQNLSLLGLVVVLAVLIRRVKVFNMGGAIAFTLAVYGAWSLGNELWALPILTGFVVYSLYLLATHVSDTDRREVKVRGVSRAILVPLLLLIVGNMARADNLFYGPFVTACVVVLGLSLSARTGVAHRSRGYGTILAGTAWAAVCIPPWAIQGVSAGVLWAAAGVSVPVVLAYNAASRCAWFPGEKRSQQAIRFLLTAAAAVLILVLQRTTSLPLWDPARFEHRF